MTTCRGGSHWAECHVCCVESENRSLKLLTVYQSIDPAKAKTRSLHESSMEECWLCDRMCSITSQEKAPNQSTSHAAAR